MKVDYDAKFLINQLHIEMHDRLLKTKSYGYILIPKDRIEITQNAKDITDVTRRAIYTPNAGGEIVSFIPRNFNIWKEWFGSFDTF